MKILSIETSSETGSISFLEDGEIKSEHSFKDPDIAGKLTGYTDEILKNNGCSPAELGLIVVSRGPGLWTGIRLGMGFAKGIASGNKAGIYCVDTAGSLFFGIKEFKVPSLCLVNAYRERMHLSFFNGRFDYGKIYAVKTVTYGQLYETCKKKKMYLTGPGITVIPEKIKRLKTVIVSPGYLSFPKSGINALLALERIKRNVPSLPLEPFYGR